MKNSTAQDEATDRLASRRTSTSGRAWRDAYPVNAARRATPAASDRPVWSEQVYRRAHERGEIDVGSIPEAVLAMPFDLMRHDLLMTLKPITGRRIRAIVDDLFLPLVTRYGAHLNVADDSSAT